jgi:hypothetical protein
VGSENGKFLTPKVLAARPNLREWWVGEKIAATNDVGDDGIVDGSSAITKNNEDSSLLYREANSNSFLVMVSRHAREFFGSRKNPEAVANENFGENSCSWTDQNTNTVFYERPISHFHIQ